MTQVADESIHKIERMPLSLQQEVGDFVNFLLNKYPQHEAELDATQNVVQNAVRPRKVRAWDKPDSLLNNPFHVGEGFRIYSKDELHERSEL